MNSLNAIKGKINSLPPDKKQEILDLLVELEEAKAKEQSRDEFLLLVHRMWPSFIGGRHHAIMADAFERVAMVAKRLIINMPPRHTKSEFASYLFPAWFLGNTPKRRSFRPPTAELAVGFGRKVRNLIDQEDFQEVFPGIELGLESRR